MRTSTYRRPPSSRSALHRAAGVVLLSGALFLAGCGGGEGGSGGTGGPDALSLGDAVPAAPPQRPSIKETTFSGVSATDPVATTAYRYIADFNELMVLPSSGRLEARHSSSCAQACNALVLLVDQHVTQGTHYEKPIWRITLVEAKPAAPSGAREVKVSLEPITDPVTSSSGEKVTLGPEWKRTVTLELTPRDHASSGGGSDQWEISRTAIAEG